MTTSDAQEVGSSRVPKTAPLVFSADDGCDVGRDADHVVDPEEVVRVAMARQ